MNARVGSGSRDADRAVNARADSGCRDADRKLHFAQSIGGKWLADVVLDPVSGAAFVGELRRLEQQLFEADWQAARERPRRAATVDELGRTAAQRRADAVVEMAIRSRGAADQDPWRH